MSSFIKRRGTGTKDDPIEVSYAVVEPEKPRSKKFNLKLDRVKMLLDGFDAQCERVAQGLKKVFKRIGDELQRRIDELKDLGLSFPEDFLSYLETLEKEGVSPIIEIVEKGAKKSAKGVGRSLRWTGEVALHALGGVVRVSRRVAAGSAEVGKDIAVGVALLTRRHFRKVVFFMLLGGTGVGLYQIYQKLQQDAQLRSTERVGRIGLSDSLAISLAKYPSAVDVRIPGKQETISDSAVLKIIGGWFGIIKKEHSEGLRKAYLEHQKAILWGLKLKTKKELEELEQSNRWEVINDFDISVVDIDLARKFIIFSREGVEVVSPDSLETLKSQYRTATE